MRLIIECEPAQLDAAIERAKEEIAAGLRRYDKPGWGWRFGPFWVCGIKGGISVRYKPLPAAR